MIKFYLVIEKMLATDLTSIIIATNYPHFNLKRDISSTTTRLGSFCKIFCNENYRANMAEYCAFRLVDFFGNSIWIFFRVEFINLSLEQCIEGFI